jgi:putative transposase
MLCRVMGVSRSGFYDYEKRVAQDPDPDHLDLVEMVRKISESSDHTYGARRMSRALKALGYEVGRRRARTLMRVAGIWVRYRKKYRVTTHSRHSHPVFS